VSDVQTFYGRWAGLYDGLARYTPGIATLRRQAALACRLEPGDTVVEMGTGTGANLPYLREQVGPTGTVIGIDVTRPALERGRTNLGIATADNVHLVQADAGRPPVRGPVDAVLGTFVSGMFEDPRPVVDRWCDLAAGGHVVLVDAATSDRPVAAPINALFRWVTVLSTPPTTKLRYDDPLHDQLATRVEAAHGRVRARSVASARAEHLLGIVRLTGGRIE